MILFQTAPRLVAREGGEAGGSMPVVLHTTWGEETFAMNAYTVRTSVWFDDEDAADREAGESSNAEFLGRLVASGSAADDAVVIEMDWEEVGPVSYTFSLEGAADAIREAGRPCGIM